MSPGSAYGCNQETCIGVVGSGLHVSYWYTTGSDTYADRCTQPAYWVAGDVAFYGSLVCGTYSYYSSLGLSNYNFPRTAQVCNTWVNGPKGKPCEEVEELGTSPSGPGPGPDARGLRPPGVCQGRADTPCSHAEKIREVAS